MSTRPRITFRQTDATRTQDPRTYILTTSTTNTGNSSSRLDEIVQVSSPSSQQTLQNSQYQQSYLPNFLTSYISTAVTYLKVLFLPTGYPHTVTPDYTPYQIYDSIQAFASTIAALLSSRAVLQSLNVISSTASSSNEADGTISSTSTEAATAATLLSILQSTLSNLTTILFASRAAPRISSDVKFYRFLADVVNDLAFILDLLAPSLPASFNLNTYSFPALSMAFPFSLVPLSITPRVLALCTSSMLRAICGVAGGSSKAVLSAHFAHSNPENVGELNAKDGSQETIINLLGMWVGGVVVSRVDGFATTWIWMLSLLGIHLWANYCAVRSVRLRGLNKERAGIVVGEIVEGQNGWEERVDFRRVGAVEGVLGIRSGVGRLWKGFRGSGQYSQGHRGWRIGVSVHEFICAVCDTGVSRRTSGTLTLGDENERLQSLLHAFEKESYIPWVNPRSGRITIVLKTGAIPRDQLKACLVASLALRQFRDPSATRKQADITTEMMKTKQDINERWSGLCEGLEQAGWDLESIHLEDGTGCRIEIHDS